MATYEKSYVLSQGSPQEFARSSGCLILYESDGNFHTVDSPNDELGVVSSPYIKNPRVVWRRGDEVRLINKEASAKLLSACLRQPEDASAARQAIAAGANVNYVDNPDTGITVLQEAAMAGHSEIIKILIENGANVNVQMATGKTGLHFAVEKLKPKALAALITGGADVSLRDMSGETATDYAKRRVTENPELFRLLGSTTLEINSGNIAKSVNSTPVRQIAAVSTTPIRFQTQSRSSDEPIAVLINRIMPSQPELSKGYVADSLRRMIGKRDPNPNNVLSASSLKILELALRSKIATWDADDSIHEFIVENTNGLGGLSAWAFFETRTNRTRRRAIYIWRTQTGYVAWSGSPWGVIAQGRSGFLKNVLTIEPPTKEQLELQKQALTTFFTQILPSQALATVERAQAEYQKWYGENGRGILFSTSVEELREETFDIVSEWCEDSPIKGFAWSTVDDSGYVGSTVYFKNLQLTSVPATPEGKAKWLLFWRSDSGYYSSLQDAWSEKRLKRKREEEQKLKAEIQYREFIASRRAAGLCEICGNKLGFFSRLSGHFSHRDCTNAIRKSGA